MKLIVNSDDFGLTPGVNFGIIDGLKRGILRSTTAMTNMPAIEQAAQLSRENPDLGVGIHLVLTAGRPLVSGHKTIVDDKGNFLKGAILMKKEDVDLEEVYTEYVAQMEKFIRVFGRKPTHIDGHHHTHAIPQTVEATKRLAKTYGIDYIRSVDPNVKFVADFYAAETKVEDLLAKLEANKQEATVELMCHLAFLDVDLMQVSSYNSPRLQELSTMIDPKIKAWIESNHVELAHF